MDCNDPTVLAKVTNDPNSGTAQPIIPSDHEGENNVDNMVLYIKNRLGYPRVRIEVGDEQIKNHIRYALTKFVSYAERPVKYYQFMTKRAQSVYPLPRDFVALLDEPLYVADSMVEFIQTFTAYQMYVNFTGNLDVAMYETLMEHLQMKINRIGAVPIFEVLYNPPRMKVSPTPQQDNRGVVYSYVSLPRLEEWTPQQDLVGYTWVLDYALAMTKETLGRIRGRFGDNVVAGDQSVVQDGAVLLAEAKAEIEKLETALEEQRPPMPIIFF